MATLMTRTVIEKTMKIALHRVVIPCVEVRVENVLLYDVLLYVRVYLVQVDIQTMISTIDLNVLLISFLC